MNFCCVNARKLTLPHQTVAQVVHWSMENAKAFSHNHYTELAPLINNTHKPSAICYAANLDNNS